MRFLRNILLYLFATSSVGTFASQKVSTDSYNEFLNYMDKYNKHYSYDEFLERYTIFEQNYKYIQEHNQRNMNWGLDMNVWMDRTWEEFSDNRVGLHLFPSESQTIILSDLVDPTDIPKSWDWREHGVVNPVKDQGQCGSCWAFSGISTIESAYALKHQKLYNLSEQQLVDCSERDNGCNGGLMDDVFSFATKTSLCESDDYPYHAHDGVCKRCEGKVNVERFVDITSRNEHDILKALLKQPISVAIEADQRGFQFYRSGVFDGECGTRLDHGVVLVGYGTENGVDYWLIRNSWGSHWGDHGYIKIRRGTNQCGVALQASYPIVV